MTPLAKLTIASAFAFLSCADHKIIVCKNCFHTKSDI
jgi:hypothetical protein